MPSWPDEWAKWGVGRRPQEHREEGSLGLETILEKRKVRSGCSDVPSSVGRPRDMDFHVSSPNLKFQVPKDQHRAFPADAPSVTQSLPVSQTEVETQISGPTLCQDTPRGNALRQAGQLAFEAR